MWRETLYVFLLSFRTSEMDVIHLSVLKSWIERREEGREGKEIRTDRVGKMEMYPLERGRMMQKIEELIQFTNTTTNSISRRERGGVVERSVPFPLSPSHCFLSVVPFRALQRGGGGGRGCNVIPPLKNRFRINRRLPIAVLPCCAVSTPLTA